METQEKGLRAAIRNANAVVQDTASKSEVTALKAVDRADAAIVNAKATWSGAKELGGKLAQSMGHAGRTTFSGIVEFNGALGRHGRDALKDTLEVGRKALAANCAKEVVNLYVDYVSRRGSALFTSINELNAIAQSKAFAAWSPMGGDAAQSERASHYLTAPQPIRRRRAGSASHRQ